MNNFLSSLTMTGWCSGYSTEVMASAMFCQLVREFESHPVHFLILFQNIEKLLSKISVSSNLIWAQKTSYPTISAHSARPFHALFARKSCNTFLESLKHTDQPCIVFVSGA